MIYSNLVMQNQQKFEENGWFKVILDLAGLLDHEQLQAKEKASHHDLAPRLEVFNDFCAVCVLCDVELPELEKEFFMARLDNEGDKDEKERAVGIRKLVNKRLKGQRSKSAHTARAVAVAIQAFAIRGSYCGAEEEDMVAMINYILTTELGLEPIRPEYGDRKVKSSKNEMAPETEIQVFIIDDDLKEITKTAHSLAGWPGLEVMFLHQQVDGGGYRELMGDEKVNELNALAEKVFSLNPSLILMDQGLNRLKGSELMYAIRKFYEAKDKQSPAFVANTDGSGDELAEAGAYANLGKGRDPKGLRQALSVAK
jgi:CheY-like chemotaxis protein